MPQKPEPAPWPSCPTNAHLPATCTGATAPTNRLTLVLGQPGAGKTVFALQLLVSAARRGEPSLFVSFTRSPGALFATAAGFGWDLAGMEKQGLVSLLTRKPPSLPKQGRPDVARALEALRAKATDLHSTRIFLDGLDEWLPSAHHPMSALEELYRLRDWLFENQFTGLVTTTLGGQSQPASSPQALMQLAADCTVFLRVTEAGGRVTRHLHLAKHRGWSLAEEDLPFILGPAGIELLLLRRDVARPLASTLSGLEIARARGELLSGLQTLDRFLELKQAELDFRLARQP